MGYRSEVCCLINVPEDYKPENFKELEQKINEPIKELFNKVYFNEKSILLYSSYIKWYDSYEDIQLFNKFLEENDCEYHFVRIGEDLEDIEEQYNGDPNIWISIERYVDIDGVLNNGFTVYNS